MTSIQAEQVYTADQLDLIGDKGAKINSRFGPTDIIGQDVKITSQDGAGASGRVTIDAIDQARINSGKKVKLTAPVIDFVTQAVIVRGTHEDPPVADRVPGMIWFHSGLKVWRGWDGVSVKTIKLI